MSIHIKLTYLALLLLLTPFWSSGQNDENIDSSNIRIKNAARDIMTSAKTCALITIDDNGRPRVRAMDAFNPEEDFTIWFGTNPQSRKVVQIKNNPKVTLYYLAKENSGYVMLQGNATLITDQEEKNQRWKPEWEAFYPNNTTDYVLIKVIPHWMEVVSYVHNLVGDSITWEPPKMMFNR